MAWSVHTTTLPSFLFFYPSSSSSSSSPIQLNGPITLLLTTLTCHQPLTGMIHIFPDDFKFGFDGSSRFESIRCVQSTAGRVPGPGKRRAFHSPHLHMPSWFSSITIFWKMNFVEEIAGYITVRWSVWYPCYFPSIRSIVSPTKLNPPRIRFHWLGFLFVSNGMDIFWGFLHFLKKELCWNNPHPCQCINKNGIFDWIDRNSDRMIGIAHRKCPQIPAELDDQIFHFLKNELCWRINRWNFDSVVCSMAVIIRDDLMDESLAAAAEMQQVDTINNSPHSTISDLIIEFFYSIFEFSEKELCWKNSSRQ